MTMKALTSSYLCSESWHDMVGHCLETRCDMQDQFTQADLRQGRQMTYLRDRQAHTATH